MKYLLTLSFLILILAVSGLFFYSEPSQPSEAAKDPFPEELFKTLPYAGWGIVDQAARNKETIPIYKPGLSYKGINLYWSESKSEAYLMNMTGKILHTWHWDQMREEGYLTHIELAPNGDLLIMLWEELIARIDWNSKIKWIYRGRVHHDIAVSESGQILTLLWEPAVLSEKGRSIPFLGDHIITLSSEGKLLQKIPTINAVRKFVSQWQLDNAYKWGQTQPEHLAKGAKPSIGQDNPSDLLHTNSVEVLSQSIKGVCESGDILISMRSIDLIGVLNLDKNVLRWSWGQKQIERQHHPTLLGNGNILLFDNGEYRKYSRILELNPITRKIVWEYKADPNKDFFSLKRGSNQRLPNGNTLIAESDSGRVFEITKEGELVWEFFSPETKIEIDEKNEEEFLRREAIARFVRITEEYLLNPDIRKRINELL